LIELIGEEIYDEFDVQGARGDPYELPHLQVPAKPEDQSKALNAYGSANSEPQTFLCPDGSLPVTSRRMSLGGLQIPKPLKGFEIFALRSHSAPPVPGDGDARINCNHPGKEIAQVPVKSTAALSEDYVNFKVDDAPQKAVLHSAGKRPPSRGANAELPGQDEPMSCNNAENAAMTTTNEIVKTISTSAVTSPQKQLGTSAPATPLYTPTPASSLEAILLDRKRRIHSYGSAPVQGTTGSTSGITTRARLPDPALSMALSSTTGNSVVPIIPRPSSAPGSKAKGTRFKSSRLGSTDLMRTSELPMEESRDGFAE
jgi:metal transporter CNNM